MEEEVKGNQPIPAETSIHETQDEWYTFKCTYEEIESKVDLKKNFYEEIKSNLRKIRSNKKNPTKNSPYYSPSSPIHPSRSEDRIYQTAIPNTITYVYEGLGSRLYNCKFTHDGQNLLVTSQTGTSFFKFSDDNKIELSKVIICNNVNWAITDSDISSDNKFMVHSTLSPYVQLFNLEQSKYVKQFNLQTGQEGNEDEEEETGYFFYYGMRIFSLKLSGDNKEVIAGCGMTQRGAPIQVLDIEKTKVKHSIIAHSNDINSICYVDKENSSIFISGSDDGKCKLWDTRILKNNSPVGIFQGHVAGLTCVSSKEDNRYFISNCKDQSIKLWDLRKARTEEEKGVPFLRFDYRYQRLGATDIEKVKELQKAKKNLDQSVMTFWGHAVEGTLIRCHFSPMYGTGQRYVYSGSADGKVYIFDTISGENIVRLNLPKEDNDTPLIRDCAWHPYSQNLISTNFFGGVQRWEYMDLRGAEKIIDEGDWETEGEYGVVRSHDDLDDVDEDEDEGVEEDNDEDYSPEDDHQSKTSY